MQISGQDKVVQTPPQEVRDLKMSESLGDTNIQYPQRLPMPVQSTPVGYCNSSVGSLSATRTVSLLGYPSAKGNCFALLLPLAFFLSTTSSC